MVLKLYGSRTSTCVRRVAIVCKELNVPYELNLVDLANGAQKSPDFIKFQPFGQVPYIDDDGFILFESRAIARYLVKKYASSLIPSDPKREALFEQAASIETANFDQYAAMIGYEMGVKKRYGLQTNEKLVNDLLATLNAKLDAYDVILSKQKYLAGEEVTLADLFHLPVGAYLGALGIDVIEKRPHVARWFNELSSRPAWVAVKDGA